VQVRSGCLGASATVQVRADQIARAELDPNQAPGSVSLTVQPPLDQVTVKLDGELVRDAQLAVIEPVACGEHHLVVVTAGYTPHEQVLQVEPFATTTLTVELEQLFFGTLVISTEPLQARVALDGERVSDGPITLEDVPAGGHTLQVKADGYVTSETTVDVLPEHINRVDVTLEPRGSSTNYVASQPVPTEPTEPKPIAGRVVLDLGTTLAGLALGALAYQRYLVGEEAYDRYLRVPNNQAANEIWDDEVRPARLQALAAGVGGGLMLGLGGALWATTDFSREGVQVAVSGRW